MSRKNGRLFLVSFLLLLITVSVSCVCGRYIPIKCCICGKHITTLSAVEYSIGPWADIPCIHPMCESYLSQFLAPNCGMSSGQWLEIRGWNPRPEETTGKTWKEIVDKETKLEDFMNK